MKYEITFPKSAGQFAGTHIFFTKKSANEFFKKALRLGAGMPVIMMGKSGNKNETTR